MTTLTDVSEALEKDRVSGAHDEFSALCHADPIRVSDLVKVLVVHSLGAYDLQSRGDVSIAAHVYCVAPSEYRVGVAVSFLPREVEGVDIAEVSESLLEELLPRALDSVWGHSLGVFAVNGRSKIFADNSF